MFAARFLIKRIGQRLQKLQQPTRLLSSGLYNTSSRHERTPILCSRYGTSLIIRTKTSTISPNTTAEASRARKNRKRVVNIDDVLKTDALSVTGFSTAEEYDLENLLIAIKEQNLYEPKRFFSTDNLGTDRDVLYVSAKYKVGPEAREIFFFREGSVVLWNFNEIEANNVLSLLKPFQREPYLNALVRGEKEVMPFNYIPFEKFDIEGDAVADMESETRGFFQNGKFYLTNSEDNFFHKYTLSDAIAASIKLGIWEATLERYIESMEFLTSDLSRGRQIRISRSEMLRKTGELFALRHVINLSSDLLDTPDFYWDRDDLEALYLQITSYFSISRRIKVMNEKLNHCVELAELISHNLNDKHHIRLEWMIIILIMVEVGFEILHFAEKYYTVDGDEALASIVSHQMSGDGHGPVSTRATGETVQ